VQIWDLRTGGISETLRYDHPITSLQFDSRKVISCTGENGIKVNINTLFWVFRPDHSSVDI
jgi:division protein 1